MSEWINIENQDPPKEIPFLAFSNGEIISSIWCDDTDQFIPNCGCSGWEHKWGKIQFNLWMPLPKPPETPHE